MQVKPPRAKTSMRLGGSQHGGHRVMDETHARFCRLGSSNRFKTGRGKTVVAMSVAILSPAFANL